MCGKMILFFVLVSDKMGIYFLVMFGKNSCEFIDVEGEMVFFFFYFELLVYMVFELR